VKNGKKKQRPSNGTKPLFLRLPNDLIAELRARAKRDMRTLTQTAELALRRAFRPHEARDEKETRRGVRA
jgi:hypothetical protein